MIAFHQHGAGTEPEVANFITPSEHLPEHRRITVTVAVRNTSSESNTVSYTSYPNHFGSLLRPAVQAGD